MRHETEFALSSNNALPSLVQKLPFPNLSDPTNINLPPYHAHANKIIYPEACIFIKSIVNNQLQESIVE